MATRKALVVKEAYLHNKDAPGLDDVLVIVSDDEVGLTTRHGNAISLDFGDLAAINRLVAEKQTGIQIQVDTSKFAAAAAASLGLAEAFSGNIRQSIRQAVEAAQQQERERARCRCHISTVDWQPNWAEIDPQWKYATVDDHGRVWGYACYPVRNDWNIYQPQRAEIIGHTHDGTVNRDKLYKRPAKLLEKAMTDVLGITWADVPVEYDFVAADSDGRVFGYARLRPIKDNACWWSNEHAPRPCRFLHITQLPPDLDWRNTLFVRPGYAEPVTPIGI